MKKKTNCHRELCEEDYIRIIEFHRHLESRIKHKNDIRHFARVTKLIMPINLVLNIVVLVVLLKWIGLNSLSIIILLIIFIGLFWLMAPKNIERRIVYPIEKLKKAMKEVADGNLNTKVEVDVMNDVGLLLSSFNIMVAKLRESEREKKEYEENRKLLVANISHDLKTPITSIEGYIEALLDKTITEESKREQYLEVIYKNTVYLNQLIDDLFLFAKLDMQKLEFNFENISINAFMRDIADEYEFEFSEKGLKFEYNDNTSSHKTVSIDRKRMSQSIRNLITNSIKYSHDDGLKVVMTLYSEDDKIYIDIKDNGIGISEENLEKVFDRFYKIDNARTKNLSSTGLGLAIAKELIEAMDGNITIKSDLGKGTTFTISLRKVILSESTYN